MNRDLSLNAADGGDRYAVLDSWRGIAACMVLLFHLSMPRGHVWNMAPVQGSWLFVDFFFVLSGFVISASYGERMRDGFPIGRFMWLRLGRLYPLHVTVLLAFAAWEALAVAVPGLLDRAPFSGPHPPEGLLLSLVFLQIFLPNEVVWNGPAWSIAAEFWTYLIAALLFAFARRLLWPLVGVAILGSAVLLANHEYLREIRDLAVFRSFYGFGFGMIAFALFRQWRGGLRWPFWLATCVELAMVAGGLVFLSLTIAVGWSTMLASPAFAVGLILFAFQAGAVSRLLLTAPFRLLGVLSYSIYLTHLFVIERFQDVLAQAGSGFATIGTFSDGRKFIDASPLVSDLVTAVLLATVIAVSWVTYSLVERPARSWSRRVAPRIGRAASPLARASA